ncbi:MAG TPA: RNA 2',3'-cyclic phosphodiesterase [Planctomycetales bacterium]|jgi:2'-5' RNA ligase|nr:RNA 2',3'-cyclic phosphodiesterase [Planctomycetales bacterium]
MAHRLRTFVAVDLGKPLRARLVSLQENLARGGAEVKWVEVENLHVTLLFLGEVDERELLPVCRAVSAVCGRHDRFTLSVDTVGCFPNPRRPRVVWAGVGIGGPELAALHDSLELPLQEMGGYRREDRHYTPHITLGRVQSDGSAEALAAALTKKANWHGGIEIEVEEVLVMSSQLTSRGPQYTVLSRGKLRKPSAKRKAAEEEE